jgi:virginiamycin B lyase
MSRRNVARRKPWIILTGITAVLLMQAGFLSGSARAQSAAALTGQVSSAEEGNMEGVVVTAKKDGSPINISVVSNDKGQFSFPAGKLEPGHYTLKIRAAGYDLVGPKEADIAAGKEAKADIKLKKSSSLLPHMTNADWLNSMPGTDEQKKFLLNCVGCHTLERIVKSNHDPDAWLNVFTRMSGYYPGSTPERPQKLFGDFLRVRDRGGDIKKVAEWLASVNLSAQEKWDWPLKVMPRLTGNSTKVIITEYDLPQRHMQPHDVIIDQEGYAWFSDFGQLILGKMDPKDGSVKTYPTPELKKGQPLGALNLEVDHFDKIWIGLSYQGAVARFDKKTGELETFPIPKEWDSNGAQFSHLAVEGLQVDGKIWVKNSDGTFIYRLDPKTKEWENLGAPKDPRNDKKIGTYGLHADAENSVYLLDFSAGNIAKIDSKTKQLSVFLTPTQNSRPRRGRVDHEGRVWFAEYQGERIGMFDPKTASMKEWKVPTAWSAPYDAAAGKNGEAWTGSMLTDRVSRLDIKTGNVTDYPLPRPTNIRRVFVDDTKTPGILWVGNNHGGSIIKVEPLE